MEFEIEMNPHLEKEERAELLKSPILATLLEESPTRRIEYVYKPKKIPDSVYIFTQYIWLTSGVIINKVFIIKEIEDTHSLSTSITKEKFSKLAEYTQTTLKQEASEKFNILPPEKQELFINQSFDELVEIKDDLPKNIQTALEKHLNKENNND